MLKCISSFLFFIAHFALANSAQACATCSFNDESNNYFLIFIIFLTSLPVIFVGSVVYYLKKQKEKVEATHDHHE